MSLCENTMVGVTWGMLDPGCLTGSWWEFPRRVAQEWQTKMTTAKLTHKDASFSLQHVLLWKLLYSLVVTTFSKQKCEEIMQPILQVGLPKAGFMCTFPRPLVYGPKWYMGLEMPHLYTEQLLAQLVMLLQYGHEVKDTMGILICTNAEVFHLESGVLGNSLMYQWPFNP